MELLSDTNPSAADNAPLVPPRVGHPPNGASTNRLERRGRLWVFGSFVLCPCHLPLTLAVLTTVLAGTSAGAVLRDYVWVAGGVVTASWILGTGYGFRLLQRSKRTGAACPVPTR